MHWFFVLALFLLIALVAMGTIRSGLLLRAWMPPYNLLLSVPDNLVRLVLIAICIVIGLRYGPGYAALGWQTGGLRYDLLLGSVFGIGLAAVLSGLGALVVRRWGETVYSNRMVQYILPISAAEWAGVLAALLPAAALEELLFRSLPLGGLSGVVGPGWLMWPLALFFGLLHWPQGWWGVVGTTFAGVVLSLLFLASGSIWLPLAAHYTMNVFQIVLASALGMKPVRAANN